MSGYADLDHKPLFLINGQIPPGNVKYGYTEDTEQLVQSQRNSQGVVVAKTIGRRLVKLNNLEWPHMTLSEFRWLQTQVAQFYCIVYYYDSRIGDYIERQFYWGDLSAEPWKFNRNSVTGLLRPSEYINVRVNLIDCGRGE